MAATAPPLPDLPLLREPMGSLRTVTDDLAYARTLIANVFFWGRPGAGDREWVLIDAGVHGSGGHIRRLAAERFGRASRPAAIVLTHGHFDHVGAVRELAELWEAPVYAHPLELPYLTGRSAYPPPDPTVGGGAMAALSFLYPRGPIDLQGRVHPLPADGSIPRMPGWRWVHTPGHAPGHISLFREDDRLLVAGDAFVTTDQESALSVLAQREVIQGPPAYFTPDWRAAAASVRRLAALEPRIAATGHGVPLRGEEMLQALHWLADDFERLAVPAHGRYVGRPALADDTGVVYVPEGGEAPRDLALLALGGAVVAGVILSSRSRRRRARRRY